MDIIRFYADHKIPYATEGHAHCQAGWVQIACPECVGNPGYHLGYCLQDNYFNCWRCGFKSKVKVITSLIAVSPNEAKKIIQRYGGSAKNPKKRRLDPVKLKLKKFRYPSNTESMKKMHKQYLKARGYDPEYLEKKYKIRGTGPASKLDKVDFKYRLVIPIIQEGKEVSWQSRYVKDFSKRDPRQKYKYITCSKEREIIHHKHLLYGLDDAKEFDWCVLCEGIMDVWRLGPPAVASFGVKIKIAQIRLLSQFQTIFITFDPDQAGRENAEKIQAQLEWMGKEIIIINNMKSDPGDMKQSEADLFMKQLEEMR